jgi:hypothetical protein
MRGMGGIRGDKINFLPHLPLLLHLPLLPFPTLESVSVA